MRLILTVSKIKQHLILIKHNMGFTEALRYYPFLYLESDCGADLLKRREARDAAQKCSIFDNFWP